MNMNSFPVFFIWVCVLIALVAVLNPKVVAEWHAKYFQWSMKVFGFECAVKPTPKAARLIRLWNAGMIIVLVSAYFLIFKNL